MPPRLPSQMVEGNVVGSSRHHHCTDIALRSASDVAAIGSRVDTASADESGAVKGEGSKCGGVAVRRCGAACASGLLRPMVHSKQLTTATSPATML